MAVFSFVWDDYYIPKFKNRSVRTKLWLSSIKCCISLIKSVECIEISPKFTEHNKQRFQLIVDELSCCR